MEEQEGLSWNNEVEPKGPNVGPARPISELAEEYVGADPVLQAKSREIASQYVSFRRSKADGNCYWRAVAFVYFELLLRGNDPNALQTELGRFRSLDNLMKHVGYSEIVFEDSVDETIGLLEKCIEWLPRQDSLTALEEEFNAGTDQHIVQHFRFLTAAWMKTHQEEYAPFLEGLTVDQYVGAEIEPHQRYINEPGMRALYDCVFKPLGIIINVINLDRNPGSQAKVISFEPQSSIEGSFVNVIDPVISMLYHRRSHYDILYRGKDQKVFGHEAPGIGIAGHTSQHIVTSLMPETFHQELSNLSMEQPPGNTPFNSDGSYRSIQPCMYWTELPAGCPLDVSDTDNALARNQDFNSIYANEIGYDCEAFSQGNRNNVPFLQLLSMNPHGGYIPLTEPYFDELGVASVPDTPNYDAPMSIPQPSIPLTEGSITYFSQVRNASPGSRIRLSGRTYAAAPDSVIDASNVPLEVSVGGNSEALGIQQWSPDEIDGTKKRRRR